MQFRSAIRRRAVPQELDFKRHILRRQEEPEELEPDEAEDSESDDDLAESPSPTGTGFPPSPTTPTATASIPPPPPPPSGPVTLTAIPPESVRASASASATSDPANIRTLTPVPPESLRASASASATSDPANIITLTPIPPESVRASASAAESSSIDAIISSAGSSFPLTSPTSTSLLQTGTEVAASPVQTGADQVNNAERPPENEISPSSDGVQPTHRVRISNVAIGMGSMAGVALIACIVFAIYMLRKRRKRSNKGHTFQLGDRYRAAILRFKPRKLWFVRQTPQNPSVKSQSKILDDMFTAAYAAEQGDGGYYPDSQGQFGPNGFLDEKNSSSTYSYHEPAGTNYGLDTNQYLPPTSTVQPSEPIQRPASTQGDMTQGDLPSRPPPVLTSVTNDNSSPRSPSLAAPTPYTQTVADAELLSLYARSSRGPSWYYKLPVQARQELESAEQRHAERRERDLAQLEAETAKMEKQISFQQAQGNAVMFGGDPAVPGGNASNGLRPFSVAQTEGAVSEEGTVSSESTWKTWQVDKRGPEKEKGWLDRILERGGLK